MKSWLHVADRGNAITGEFRLVFDPNQAVEMTENNAHELMRRAQVVAPEYTWEMVRIPSSNLFVVEGTRKK